MRHSFLPIPEQKILKREYLMHVMVVALFVLSIAGLIGVIALFPAYIAVSTEESAQQGVIATLKKNQDTSGVGKIEKELRADAVKVSALSSATSVRPSMLIRDILGERGSVRVTGISVDTVGTTSATVIVQGNAPTRESLVSFKTRLEGLAQGDKVELPISELAKSKDIPFSLRITHKLQ